MRLEIDIYKLEGILIIITVLILFTYSFWFVDNGWNIVYGGLSGVALYWGLKLLK